MYSLAYSTEDAHDASIWCCTWGYADRIINDKSVTDEEAVTSTTKDECIVTGSLDDTLKVWLVGEDSLKLIQKYEGESLGLVAVALNDYCTLCATTSIDSNLVYRDLVSGNKLNEINTGAVDIWSVAFAPDNKHVITGGQSGKVNMFTVPEGAHELAFDTNGKFVLSIAFSPDGKHVACGRVDGIINIFDVESAKLTHTLEGHALPVRTLCFSSDSEYLVTGSDDGHMKIYAVKHSEIIGAVSGHSSWVLSVSYSPNGKYFISSSSDRSIKIWKTSNLKCVQILKQHSDQVWSAKFNSDGTKIVSVSEDKTINIYRLKRNVRYLG